MSFHSSLESKFPDSVRTLGQLESIDEEEQIFHKHIGQSAADISQIKNVNPKNLLDKEKTLYFRSAIFNDDSPEQSSNLAESLKSEKCQPNVDNMEYKLIGISDDSDGSGEFASDALSESKSNLERWDHLDSLKDIKTGTEKISITSINTNGDAIKNGENPKKSKWSLFFKNSKSKGSKSKSTDPKRSNLSKKLQRFLPRGKSFVAPSNEEKESKLKKEKELLSEAKNQKKTAPSKSIQSETERLERDYQILNQLGSGGHSVVHLAERKSDGKKVVVKYIQCVSVWHWHTDSQTGTDIPLEIHMLQKFYNLSCPGIIKYYDYFDLGSQFVIIMEYLGEDWVDLYDYIETFGPVCERDANEIFSRVVSVVCYLHRSGYCHNDIKDENVMINVKTRQIKLIDFGSLTNLQSGVTHNTFYGTRKFQSPEAIQGAYLLEYQEVWALGTLYYVLLFKMDPFKNDEEVLQVDILRRMERIRHFGVDGMLINISDAAINSIKKMLDRDWTKRPTVCEILSLPAFKKQ